MRTLTCLLFASLLAGSASAQIVLSSPEGKLETSLTQDAKGQLVYSVRFNGQEVLAPSPMGVTVDGVQYGAADELGKVTRSSFHEKFPWRGNKSQVDVRGKSAEVTEDPTQFAIVRGLEVSATTSRPFQLNAGGGLVVRVRPAGAGSK